MTDRGVMHRIEGLSQEESDTLLDFLLGYDLASRALAAGLRPSCPRGARVHAAISHLHALSARVRDESEGLATYNGLGASERAARSPPTDHA